MGYVVLDSLVLKHEGFYVDYQTVRVAGGTHYVCGLTGIMF